MMDGIIGMSPFLPFVPFLPIIHLNPILLNWACSIHKAPERAVHPSVWRR